MGLNLNDVDKDNLNNLLQEVSNLNIEDYGRILKRFSQEELRGSEGILTQAAAVISRGNGKTNERDSQSYKPEKATELMA